MHQAPETVSGPTTSLLEVRVTAVQPAADGVLTLTLAGDGPLPSWSPGAHIDLHLGNGQLRQYSLCGDPGDATRYRVAVLRERDSRGGSQWIHEQLTVGDQLTVSVPRNNFELRDSAAYLFVAGGIGITPVLAMVQAAAERGADWRLLYGGRTRASMAFLDELARHSDRVVVHPQEDAGLLPLNDWLAEARENTLVYACGPEPLIEAVQAATTSWPAHTVHFERFRPPEEQDAASDEAFEVVLARSNQAFDVPAGQSILQVLEDHGIIVLSSCREGTCGTCETKVLEGTPDHRDWVLSEQEKADNDTMMVCVSRACSRRLVVDL